ncbi:MAG: NADH:ubiquinone reductase (Na(+)-transporting) subunit E [Rhabdochlamydiaceae bacterium]|nr:NADH:ubiquinone reductase (Na(+)-transporting) subunit E [Candidatus Amphrikana amoebophyrae]
MWMGDYSIVNLVGLLIQSVFIQNILLFYFLGMCSYLACSNTIATAKGLGLAVTIVITLSGVLNWFVHQFVTGPGALSWLKIFGINGARLDLSFLEFLIFISIIAAFVQVLEIIIEKFTPSLYRSLGMYLPLITVNCAILGASLFSVVREYPFFANFIYVLGAGLGWWLAIVLIASIREKLGYSDIPSGLKGMGITFIMTGLIALAFMGFTGISLDETSKDDTYPELVELHDTPFATPSLP